MRSLDPLVALGLLCAVVFFEFLAMGVTLAVIPGQVHNALGFAPWVVGLVLGAQSFATLLTRQLAGARTDRHGPAHAVIQGLLASSLAGAATAASGLLPSESVSLCVLIVARALLGFGESLVITGALAWGFALAGRERTGLVMAWVGMMMYGALAVGAPVGSWVSGHAGFSTAALAAVASPLVAWGVARLVPRVTSSPGAPLPFVAIAALLWRPGLGLLLCTMSFGALAAFTPLLFAERGWSHAPLAMTAFGASYVVARILFGGFPDRFGGARVAVVAAALAVLGQLGFVLADSSAAAIAAAGVTGFGFSLAFPALGVEAMKRVAPKSRGAAVGAYTAFFDAALGFGVPALGATVGIAGAMTPFAVAAFAAAGALILALSLARASSQ